MGKNKEQKFLLKYTNRHLLNIFDQNYYIELGSIDLEVLNEILDGAIIDFKKIAVERLLVEGTGKITGDARHELEYQLNYLKSFCERDSSTKLFLTCGIIKYYTTIKQEVYAPLLLIPIKLYQTNKGTWEVVRSGEVIENELLMQRLRELTIEPLPKAEDFKTAFDFDRYCEKVSKASGCVFTIGNFLTYALTEYPDLNFVHEESLDTSSFFEYRAADIYGQALEQVQAVLPSNIYQKYVMVKAHRNENFSVGGKLGSGKTSTIINIIADSIAQNKQVLYVNSDQRTLEEFHQRLYEVGLGNYAFNLVNPFHQPKESPTEKKYHLRGLKKTLQKIQSKILTFDELLDHKYLGYRYREIIQNQLELMINGYVHEPLPIVPNLSKFEVETIYEKLKEIEQALSHIGPYENFCWRTLEPYYTSSDIKEVGEATTTFHHAQVELKIAFKEFNDRYHLKPTATIKEAHRVIYILKGFSDNIPPYSWHVNKDFKKASKEIINLKNIQTDYNNLQAKIASTYTGDIETVDIDAIFKTLLGPYYETKDNIYLDRLLYNLKSLKTLAKRIAQNRKDLNEALNSLKAIFRIKAIEDHMYNLLADIDEYLDYHECQIQWVHQSYDNNPNILEDYHHDYLNYIEFNDLQDQIKRYLKKGATIDYQALYSLLTTEASDKVLQKIINFKLLKEDSKYMFDLIAMIRRYLELVEILNNKLKKHNFKEYGELAQNYLEYQAYVDLLDKPQRDKIFIKKILVDYLTKVDKKRMIAKERLAKFSKCYLDNLDIIKQLKYYNINITHPQATKKLSALYQFVQYFNNVYTLNEKYRPFFKKNNLVLFEDYQDLQQDIQLNQKLKSNLKSKDSEYQYLFGEYYRGFNTDCVVIERMIAYFQLFLEIVIKPKDLDDLLLRDTLQQIINHHKRLERIYENWYSCYRRFTKLFQDSKTYFLEDQLEKNIESIEHYVNEIYLLPDAFTVIENLVFLKKFGLNELCDGINKGIYANNLSIRFMATLYQEFQAIIEKDNPLLKNFDDVLLAVNDYLILERELLSQNIDKFVLKRTNPSEKIKNKQKLLSPFDVNHMVEMTKKDYNLYLVDLDLFNSNLNLRQFDTIIIDDAHLDNSNKYYRLDEPLNQIIIFGDKTFTSSVSNNLMQRIIPSAITPLKYRYQLMSNYFENQLGHNNIYIPRFDENVEIKKVASLDTLVKDILFSEVLSSKPNQIINIVYANNNTKFKINQLILNTLNDYEKASALMKKVNLLNAVRDDAILGDDVYFIFDDFKMMETEVLQKVLTNFNQATNKFYLVYQEEVVDEKNEQMNFFLSKLKERKELLTPSFNPVIRYLKQELEKHQLECMWGLGAINLIVQGRVPYGIIIIGLETEENTLIDLYQYYYQTFEKFGWKMEFIYAPSFVQNPQGIVKKIVKAVMKHDR